MAQPPPNTSFDSVAKFLTGAIAIVITAAGTIGAASGGLAFLLRNKPGAVITAIGMAAVAAFIAGVITVLPQDPNARNVAWRNRAIAFFISAALLAISLGIVLNTQLDLQRISSRPVVSADWVSIGTGGRGLKVTAEADSLAITEALYIGVTGPSSTDQNSPTFYWGATGPDANGKAKQQVTVVINTPDVETVSIVSAVLDRESTQQGATVDCQGKIWDVTTLGISAIPSSPEQEAQSTAASSEQEAQPTEASSEQVEAACLILNNLPPMPPTATPG